MRAERCLYTLLHVESEHHDGLLQRFVAPIVEQLEGDASLHSYFFARYNKPDWQLRFRVLGEPDWIEQAVEPLVVGRLSAETPLGQVRSVEYTTYEREWERYGGPVGMPLCEQLFRYDSAAALTLVSADREHQLDKSRREYCMLFCERFLDALGFTHQQRLTFYEFGYRWARELGSWEDEHFVALERKYQQLKPALAALFAADRDSDIDGRWGGRRARECADRFFDQAAPTIEALRAGLANGSVVQQPEQLAWSLMHMQCNRLAVEAFGEAVIRFFMHRLHQDRLVAAA